MVFFKTTLFLFILSPLMGLSQDTAGKNSPELPEYRPQGGQLYIYEPVIPPEVISEIDLEDLSYSTTYNMYFVEKDTIWKQNLARYQSRTAKQVVIRVFDSIALQEDAPLLKKNYTEVVYKRFRKENPYKVHPSISKNSIREFLLPSSKTFQLFLETRTYLSQKSNELHTRIFTYVLNTESFSLEYFDNLAFKMDIRDNKTYRAAIELMLLRLKENSGRPVRTPEGQNRK